MGEDWFWSEILFSTWIWCLIFIHLIHYINRVSRDCAFRSATQRERSFQKKIQRSLETWKTNVAVCFEKLVKLCTRSCVTSEHLSRHWKQPLKSFTFPHFLLLFKKKVPPDYFTHNCLFPSFLATLIKHPTQMSVQALEITHTLHHTQ